MKTVILCGGKGTRLREETEFKPKPLVEIGGRPILWHIMKIYSEFNQKDFVLALGKKGEMIKEYFMGHDWRSNDFTLHLKDKTVDFKNTKAREDWNIDFVDTGDDSLTALRLYNLKDYLEGEDNFMLTYGDGLANVDIDKLIKFHLEKGKILTITGLHPRSKYGVVKTTKDGLVTEFKEKPILDNFINGGFMIFNKRIFDILDQRNVMLVDDTLPKLAEQGEVALYHHEGYWHCMDTYKDYLVLNEAWNENPEWKIWDKDIKKVLITGGAGFIGSHLVELLVNRGYKVSVLEQETAKTWRIEHLLNKINYYSIDKDDLDDIFKQNKFDAVIHLATFYKKSQESPDDAKKMQETNIIFPTKILDLCCKYHVKYFINTGTFFEYKLNINEPLREDSIVEPFNLYAATKIAFENNLKYYTSDKKLKAITLRLFAPYGEKDNEKLVVHLIKNLLSGERLSMTKGEQQWSFTYVEDIANAYLKTLEYIVKMDNDYQTFNIGSAKTANIRDIAGILENISEKKFNIAWGERDYPENEIFYAKCCNDKAKNILNWQENYNIEKGLEKTLKYYLKQNGNL